MAEGARLLSECRGKTSTAGSNPALSAIIMQIKIIYCKRKTISLQITSQLTLLVKAPIGTSQKTISSIIESNRLFIERKINEIKIANYHKNSYESGEKFYYLGKELTLQIINANKNCISVENQTIFLYLKKRSSPRHVLLEWYKKQAFVFINERLQYYKELLNCNFNSITITSAKKRLGSCDSKGNLRFSFYNVLLSKDYIDYIVVHELCHLFYLNHSKAFWQMVENIMPDFKQKRLWLRKNFHIIAYSL